MQKFSERRQKNFLQVDMPQKRLTQGFAACLIPAADFLRPYCCATNNE
jgi:hypothetical protein